MVFFITNYGISQAQNQPKNLIQNGGFENGLWDWSRASNVVSQMDTNIKYKGNTSLRMQGDSTNTWNVVRSKLFPCYVNEKYTLQLYCRNTAYSGSINVGLRWLEKGGGATLRYDWFSLKNDTPWELYSFPVAPPAGASEVQIILYLEADVVGSVWFDEISLLEGELEDELVGSGPMGFRGTFCSEVSYTPEERWIAGNRMQLFTDIAFGTSTKAYVHLGGWLPRADEFLAFDGKGSTHAQFNIKHAYIEVDGPWTTGLPPLRTTFGGIPLAYSPYVLKLDRWDLWYWDVMEDPDNVLSYNRMRNGISVESRENEKISGACFMFFDGKPDIYAFGGKMKFDNKGTKVIVNAVNYLDNVGVLADQEPNRKDLTLSLDVSTSLGKIELSAFRTRNEKKNSVEPAQESFVNLASLRYPINNYCYLKYNYWSIDRDFDPIYRDRTPRYHPYTGEKLAWNPVDRYSGQIGSGICISIINLALSLELQERQAIQYREVEERISKKEFELNTTLYGADFLVSGDFIQVETPQNELSTRNVLNERHLYASGLYPLATSKKYDLNLEANHSLHECDFSETRNHLLLSGSIKTGFLEGAKFFAGRRSIIKPGEGLNGFVSGIDLMLAKAVKLSIRYATPKEEKELNSKGRLPMYNQFGDEYAIDNLIKLSASLQF